MKNKITTLFIALGLLGGGALGVDLAVETKVETISSIETAQQKYFQEKGEYFQIKKNGGIPERYKDQLTINTINGIKKRDDLEVHTQKYPDGSWGYSIIEHIPFVSSTSTSAFVLNPLFAFFVDTAYAITENTHSTDLESTSSQSWEVADTASLSVTGDMTISIWYKPESQPGRHVLVSKWDEDGCAAGDNKSYTLQYFDDAATKKILFAADGDGSPSSGAIAQTLTNATWYHIVAQYDASAGTAVIYVDGSSIGTISSLDTSMQDTCADFDIGAERTSEGGGANFADGLIDDVQVYSNATVSASDLFNSPCAVTATDSGLQGWWLFDNDGLDETSNNNDLTNNNSATFSTDAAYECASVGEEYILLFS